MSFDSDIKILQKYYDGAYLDPEDVTTVRRLSSIGLINTGVDFNIMRRTARTAGIGRSLAWKYFPWYKIIGLRLRRLTPTSNKT